MAAPATEGPEVTASAINQALAGPALPVLAGLGVAEALVAAALAQGWFPAAFLLHLGACVMLPLLPRGEAGTRGAAALRLARWWLPALGPAAALGALAALLLAPTPARGAARDMPEDPIEARLLAVASARELPDGLLLEALGDALRWGNARQKAMAIEIAAAELRPGGEALLRLALSDPDPEVRGHAEAARPRLESLLLARIETLRGGDPRALARHLDRAAFSGLLDPPRAAACREEAAHLWARIAAGAPDDGEAQAALGRALLALGRLDEARAALEAALERSVATPSVLGWLAECLHRARDHAALEALVARWQPAIEREAAGPGVLAPGWRLWLGRR